MSSKSYTALFLYSFIVVIIQLFEFAAPASLYAPDDPLWELDSSNFNRIVFGKNHAWIIEFYNSWCGHCIRFVPTWKAFARDTENWKSVIEVGVVNCVEPENVRLCRDYGVEGYPTLKMFGAQLNESDKGEALSGKRDLDTLRHSVITFLETQEFVPANWPALKPVNASQLTKLRNEQPASVGSIYVVIESPDSIAGREVILDLSAKRNIVMKRVLTTNTPLVKELVNDEQNISAPIFLKINKNGDKEIIQRFDEGTNDTYIRDQIFDFLVGEQRVKDEGKVTPEKPTGDQETIARGVYMADLENAVRYSLRQEVGVHSDITGPKLVALKAYLAALRTYFPGSQRVMGYLIKLHNWVLNRKGNLTGERFIIAMDQLQTEKEFLPDMHEWVGCKGSTPKYRGYPCSLWTLFHTLTVQAYNMYDDSPNFDKTPQKILFTIRDYVKYFFTCQDCKEHFLSMSENLEKELKGPKDTALWLWQAHNQVNKRLAGDETEDPKHPKIQFPPEDACRQCRVKSDNGEIEWDKNAVLRYLQYFYRKEHIKPVQNRLSDNTLDLRQRKIIGNEITHEGNAGDKGTISNPVSEYSLLLALFSLIGWFQGY